MGSPSRLLRTALLVAGMLATMAIAASGAAASPVYRGAQVHSLETWAVSVDQMNRELDALHSAGANAVRVDVNWSALEPAQGQYSPSYLARLDAFMAGANQRGLAVIATVACTPAWASAGGQWNDAPSRPSDYGNVAEFLAGRYGTKLAALEAWNEPNVNNNLVAADLPAAYTAMVEAFFAGARQGNPQVPVLMGSLSYADLSFLRALYAHGIKGHYDGVSVHPYADGADPADLQVTHSFLGGIESLHRAQALAADNTPVWVTEFGWPTGTSRGANSQRDSAAYVAKAFRLLDSVPYVRGATVYQLRDMATDPSNPEDNFGLLSQNFTPRPAYVAFALAMGVGVTRSTAAAKHRAPRARAASLSAGRHRSRGLRRHHRARRHGRGLRHHRRVWHPGVRPN